MSFLTEKQWQLPLNFALYKIHNSHGSFITPLNALALWLEHNANRFMLHLSNAHYLGCTAFTSGRPF